MRSEIEVRLNAGEDQPVIGRAEGRDLLQLLGERVDLDDGTWWLVRVETLQGWVQADEEQIAPSRDVTTEMTIALNDASYTSVEVLARAVASNYSTVDPVSEINIVFSTLNPPSVTIDVVGLGDDSLAGYRLIVTGRLTSTNPDSYQLFRVEEQTFCVRGLSPEGLCL